MRIDIHSHTAPAKYIEAIRRDPKSMGCRIEKDDQGRESIVQDIGRSTRLRASLIDPERRLRQVAAEQIDVIVESLLPPLLPLWAPTAIAVRVCQIVNDAIAEDAVRFPGRMVAMGILPLQDVGEAIRELDRLVKQHRMPSVLIPASVHGKNFDEPEFFPFFERAQELDVLIFIHPHEVAAADRLKRYALTNLIGNPLETTIAQASLIFGGVLERLPKLENLLRPCGRLLALDSRALAPRSFQPPRSERCYHSSDLRISQSLVLRHLHLRPRFAGVSHSHDGQRPRPVGHRLSYADDRCGTGFGDQWHRRTHGGGQREGFGRQRGEAVGIEVKLILPNHRCPPAKRG